MTRRPGAPSTRKARVVRRRRQTHHFEALRVRGTVIRARTHRYSSLTCSGLHDSKRRRHVRSLAPSPVPEHNTRKASERSGTRHRSAGSLSQCARAATRSSSGGPLVQPSALRTSSGDSRCPRCAWARLRRGHLETPSVPVLHNCPNSYVVLATPALGASTPESRTAALSTMWCEIHRLRTSRSPTLTASKRSVWASATCAG